MKCHLSLFLCLGTLGFASCATVASTSYNSTLISESARASAQESAPRKQKTDHVRIEVFRQDFEFDDIKLEVDGGPTSKLLDSDRERTGLRATFGGSSVRGFVQFFAEEWDLAPGVPGFDFDLLGLGGGVAGTPTLHQFDDDIRLTLPFRAGLNLAVGSNDSGGALEADLGYVELEGEIGFGGDFFGAQPSVGVYASSVSGIIAPDSGADADITGTNSGTFVQLFYKHADFPVFGSIRATSGDVDGGLISFGVAF